MKKTAILFLSALTSLFFSCQSVKVPEQETVPPDFSADGGKTLDGYWLDYFATLDPKYLDRILAYAESEDVLSVQINRAYSEGTIDESLIECLSMKNEDGILTSDYDLDALSIFFLEYGDEELSGAVKYIYSLFPQDVLIRNAVKSSAYWSLASNAGQSLGIRLYLEQKLPEIPEKTANIFTDLLNVKRCLKKLENTSNWNESGYGASTAYYFYSDGTWIKQWYEKGALADSAVFTANIAEAQGTYEGKPCEDGIIQMTVTHERYWQQMDSEIRNLKEAGTVFIADGDLSALPALDPVRTEVIEIKSGKLSGK